MQKIILSFITLMTTASVAYANGPVNWSLGMQESASPVHERMHAFHNDLLLPIIAAITLFVLALLIIVVLRFNRRANPSPSKTTHNVPLEIAWTVIPVVILIVISIRSFELLYYTDRGAITPEMTLKVTGYQWYWGYAYPDQEIDEFSSYMVADKDIDAAQGQKRLLSTDNVVVLPVDTDIEIIITAADVLHSFAMPPFGIKTDAVPGRLNQSWVRITKPGTYYGQCSELCGKGHAYMPIEVHAVPKEVFQQWAALAKTDLEKSYEFLKTAP
ncbi:MAG: cytochrome c oxidase subunit II [Rhodospirillales bacterium]|nr:cytochrome c oxidase subunit II [Rhodospirillales bacterium]MCB9979684.1 cytochrome c oxidase subunit II [Rhodospirillales bacterium]